MIRNLILIKIVSGVVSALVTAFCLVVAITYFDLSTNSKIVLMLFLLAAIISVVSLLTQKSCGPVESKNCDAPVGSKNLNDDSSNPVSYTHLTLPTKA